MKELIDYARANPDKVAYGSNGMGSGHHFNGEQIQQYTGIRLRHIPYKGTVQSYIDIAAGEISMVIGNASAAKPFVKPAEAFQARIKEHIANAGKIARAANIKPSD